MSTHGTAELWKVALFLVVFGTFFVYRGIWKLKKTQKIANTPRSRIRSAPQGYVEFEGFAWPKSQTTRLASGLEAVYSSLILERQDSEGSGKNRRRVWRQVFSHTENQPFYVCDATGLCEVDLTNADLEIEEKSARAWGSLNPEEKQRIIQLAKDKTILGFPPSTFLFGLFSKKFRVREREILAGSPLYVNGDFRTYQVNEAPEVAVGLEEFSQRVFNLEAKSNKNMKTLFDKNRDGKLDHKEMQQGYSLLATTALRKKSPHSANFQKSSFGTLRSSETHKLYLADTTEDLLVKRIKSKGLMELSFGALGIVGAFVIFFPGTWLSILGTNHASTPLTVAPPVEESIRVRRVQPRRVASLRSPGELHSECASGKKVSCQILLEKQNQYNLSKEQIRYYEILFKDERQ